MKRASFGRELLRNLSRSVYIAVFVGVVFTVAAFWSSELLVASLGASAFIAFTFPRANSSRPRFLLGGYACGCVWGCAFALLRGAAAMQDGTAQVLFCTGAVLLTALSMSIFDFEHPPAVALAIGLTLADRPLPMAGAALLSIAALCVCRQAMNRAGAQDAVTNRQKEE